MSLWRWLGIAAYRLAWPGLFVYLLLRPRTRVLVLAEGHVLLVQSWMSDVRWGLPGGGVHYHELSLHGAVREVAEEAGLVLHAEQFKSLGSEWRSRDGLKFYCHFFAVQLEKRTELRRQRGEIVQVGWIPLSELKAVPHKIEVDRALQLLAAHA